MKFKHFPAIAIFLQLFVLSFFLSGCGSLQPGADPVVVNAERVTAIALDVMDSFLKFEHQNRATLERISPDIHKVAENIRRNGKKWLESARALTVAYKANRSDENKFQLMTAIAVLESAIAESHKYIAVGSTQ